MAVENFVFNRAKGRVNELLTRVDTNDPANSAVIVIVMSAAGSAAQGQDLDDFAAVEADANFAEATGGTTPWGRKTLTDADIALPAPTDASDFFAVTVGNLVFTPSADTPDAVAIIFCYDNDTTAGNDSNLIPMVQLIATAVSDGSQITFQSHADGFFKAT